MDRQFFIASAQAMERSMYCIARSYLRCEADCEDALQNALLRAWEKALDGPQNYALNTTDTLAYTSGMYNAPDPNHESQNLDMKGGAAHV